MDFLIKFSFMECYDILLKVMEFKKIVFYFICEVVIFR